MRDEEKRPPPERNPKQASKQAEERDRGAEESAGFSSWLTPFQMPGAELLEPHESLKYIARLFKGLAIAVFLLLISEVALGVAQDGIGALPLLLLEVAQLLIFAGLLWGGGDLAYLIVETNHDVRASRVHLWQLNMLRQMDMRSRGILVEPVDTENPPT